MGPRGSMLPVIALAAGLSACASSPAVVETPTTPPPPPPTAQEIIAGNLEAVGGAERVRAIRTMVITGGAGSALLGTPEELTLFLARPDRFKQQGLFSTVLADGGRLLANDGVEESEITGSSAEELGYRLGFYHNAFSLLKWEEYFPTAELEGVKSYGPTRQYALRLPGAENGRDLLVYVDADTLLVDRVVFTISHPEARELQIVNRLRDFQEFDGILMPTRLVYDKVGWEVSPSHFLIREVEINRPLDNALFADADVDFGRLTVEPGTIHGEIRGVLDGALLTNVRFEDMARMGVELGQWLEVRVGDSVLRARLLDNIQRSATEVRPEEVYLCRYPISRYPRLMLMGFGVDVEAALPSTSGDALTLTPAAETE